MCNGLITRLNIGLKRLENDIKNMSEDEVENRKLDYLRDLGRTIVDTSQKNMKQVKNLMHKDNEDKDLKY